MDRGDAVTLGCGPFRRGEHFLMSASVIYALRVECEGLVVRVVMNDVDVFDDWTGARRVVRTEINPYIIEGSNRLEVLLTPMTDDDGQVMDTVREFQLTLIKGEPGHGHDDPARIAHYEWREDEAPVTPGALTDVWSRQFNVRPEHAFGRWVWQDSPSAVPGQEDSLELLALTEIVHSALERRDVDAVVELTAWRDRELARAHGISIDAQVAGQRARYEQLFASPAWSLEAFDPQRLAASPHARGRLMRVTDAVGDAPIKGTDGKHAFTFPIMACRIDGSWTIVR